MTLPKTIEIDGRTGEGGGQLVRVAIALSAVTSQAVRITNVRGNRARGGNPKHGKTSGTPKGGGLKAQHVTAIRWLAEATDADVEGLEVGSSTLLFAPRLPPPDAMEGKSRTVKIVADTGAASTLLILQAVLPFLLYAAGGGGEEDPGPIELEMTGGTHGGMSLTYDYLDQVLLPRLEAVFGINVSRRLEKRGWTLGPQSRGALHLTVHPLRRGEALRALNPNSTPVTSDERKARYVDVSVVAPCHMHPELRTTLARDLAEAFPGVEVVFKTVEDSGHDARIYALLVARSADGTLRWGRDILSSTPKARKQKESIATIVSRKVVQDLARELAVADSTCDEFLQDQLVIFQALADGETSFPRSPMPEGADAVVPAQVVAQPDGKRMRRDRTDKPFGDGSMHSQTARWVASEILPAVKWYNKGAICKGIGTSFS